ncbi:MAG: cell wall hydrolase [Clostridia bacterium]|nr:cell wall hydrolase [Clostridia bacterium]
MKKIISFVLVFTALLSFSIISVDAASSVGVYINNERFTGNVQVTNNTTYVGIRKFAYAMDDDARVTYTSSNRTLTVETDNLKIVCKDKTNYINVNGRYFYYEQPIYMKNGIMYAPILNLYKAFGANIKWTDYRGFDVTTGSGYVRSGDSFYKDDEVYWLARIIYAESGAEPLKGKIAVGNVILNRVRSSYFPNTIYGVIFDKKNGVQFSPTINGAIYKTPNAESIIAAKICLEGYSVNKNILYFINPYKAPNSWVSKNRTLFAQIGNHAFYY